MDPPCSHYVQRRTPPSSHAAQRMETPWPCNFAFPVFKLTPLGILVPTTPLGFLVPPILFFHSGAMLATFTGSLHPQSASSSLATEPR